jgi:hypothetical protein
MRPKHVSVLTTQEIHVNQIYLYVDLHLTLILPVLTRQREFEIYLYGTLIP